MAKFKKWRGKEVTAEVAQNVALALGELALRAEGYSKKELEKGHGVETGTLRRSIHTAQPSYVWIGDNVKPSRATPERGSKQVKAAVNGSRITVQLGSGLSYALAVHQGHGSFKGYHYLTNGVEKAKGELGEVLRKHRL